MKKLLSLSLMLSLGLATVTPALNAAQSQIVAESQANPAHVSGWQAAKKWWRSGRNMNALNPQEKRAFSELRRKFAIGTYIAAVATAMIALIGSAHLRDVRAYEAAINRSLVTEVLWGNLPSIERLLAAGADVNAVTENGEIPLIAAAHQGHLAVMERLLDAGADVNAANRSRATPLMIAAQQGHLAVVERLLAVGADVNAKDEHRLTPLTVAAYQGHLAVVERLLANEADVNSANIDGDTPLMLSASRGHQAVVERLLPYASDENRVNAIQVARERGHPDLAKMIEDFRFGALTKPTRQPDVAPLPAFGL